ncbi:MAG: glycosyltransferase family A protein [Bryobacteraceae bacterium]
MSQISVIVPMFNAEKYLEAALDSILAQTHLPSELVLIDDGSTDSTHSIAQEFQRRNTSEAISIVLLRQEHAGPGAARNLGLEHCGGSFLSFLDADDLWAKEKLAWQMAEFARDPELELVTGEVQNFFSPELDPSLRDQVKFVTEPMQGGAMTGTILARREAFLRTGTFDASVLFGDFLPWLAKARDLGIKAAQIGRPVLFRRVHLSNFSRVQQRHHRDYLIAAKRALDERRRSGQNQ